MWKNPRIVFNKRPNFEKLTEYGFVKEDKRYIFSTDIMNSTFRLTIYVSESGVTELQVIDNATDEEYTLVYVAASAGAFVRNVRTECENVLADIVEKCYEPHIFKSEYAKLVIQYVRDKYGTEAEYLWEKFPNNAIFREAATQKWYAALLTVEKQKLGIKENGIIEIIDLKEAPEIIVDLVDGVRYLAGYHMNKIHWYTIRLDGTVPIEEIYKRIDNSFNILPKKK